MKKKTIIITGIILSVLLCGCSRPPAPAAAEAAEAVETTTNKETVPTVVETEPEIAETELVNTEVDPISSAGVEVDDVVFKKLEYQYEDKDGYQFKISIDISPWMLYSTKLDTINNTWTKVSKGNTLPDFEDWDFQKNDFANCYVYPNQSFQNFKCSASNFDMFYAVGQVSVSNITEGFDITESNERSVAEVVWLTESDKNFNKFGIEESGSDSRLLSMVMYGNGTHIYYSNTGTRDNICPEFASGICVCDAKLRKNTWGPVPFVIMHGEYSSPKFPNGRYREALEENGKAMVYDNVKEIWESVDMDVMY